jgi:hypothetical protein
MFLLLLLLLLLQALGQCLLLPKDCSGADDQCNVGVCSFSNGLCEKEAANEGGGRRVSEKALITVEC